MTRFFLSSDVSRRRFLSLFVSLCGAVVLLPLVNREAAMAAAIIEKITRTELEWRKTLSPEAFAVLRQEGTERPYTSPLNDEHREGLYVCAGCALPLFPSAFRFESGTGWPSFFDVIADHIETKTDTKLLVPRTEYHCRRCGGHQGHVFNDGPPPTGLRYCNNGVALRFIPEEGAS